MRRLRHAEKIGQQNITVGKIYREAEVVRIDGAQIREAIDSIIANAIEAMPAGGFLTINTDKGIRCGTWPLDCNKDSRGRGGKRSGWTAPKAKAPRSPFFSPTSGQPNHAHHNPRVISHTWYPLRLIHRSTYPERLGNGTPKWTFGQAVGL
jgi:hypothetical protein